MLFRAQMLTEMARMSVEDGLVMQIHPGACATTTSLCTSVTGATWAADIPSATDYVHALRPLLDRFGNEKNLTIILFMLDETTLQPRTGAAGRPLSVLAPRTPVVVS